MASLSKTIRDELVSAGVEKITIEYNGEGDDGSIGDLVASPVVDISKWEDTLADFAIDFLSEQHGGWEINDGSYGDIVIDLKTGQVTNNHSDRVISTNESTSELTLEVDE